MSTLGTLVFGESATTKQLDKYGEITAKGKEASVEEAQIVLSAIVHPETKGLIARLQEQMDNKDPAPTYTTPTNSEAEYDKGSAGLPYDSGLAFFFSDDCFRSEIYARLLSLIEAANPEYSKASSEFGSLRFVKKKVEH
ncbi:hypothetical protein GOV04_00105 [Candidatus Woesearchaeota archaeon]|nr:hypothetical protein [Candidatus Woesearchaeota archaeon]